MPERRSKAAGRGWLTGLRDMPNDSPAKMLVVAVSLCLVCSVFVSGAAVLLKPRQERNATLATKREILRVAGLFEEGKDIDQLFGQVDTRIIELASGNYADEIDPLTFDYADASRDPEMSEAIPPENDIAKIRTKARYAPVYLVTEDDAVQTIILPVRGYGLWSTMHGFVALARDARTIQGITFYEHGETAGLGAEVSNPRWLAKWQNKLVYDDDGAVRIEVIKGAVNPTAPDAAYQVDGLAGATLTANGVTHLMHYWLGAEGFGPYLAKFRSRGGMSDGG